MLLKNHIFVIFNGSLNDLYHQKANMLTFTFHFQYIIIQIALGLGKVCENAWALTENPYLSLRGHSPKIYKFGGKQKCLSEDDGEN